MTDLMGVLERRGTSGTVTLQHRYATTPDDLWQAITSPDRMGRWLGEVSGDLRPGGAYVIAFEPDDDQQRSWGTVLECEPPRLLRVSWQSPDEPAGQVTATLTTDGDGTLLHLVHEGLPHGVDTGYAAGWQVHLAQLEANLAGQSSPDFWQSWQELRDAYEATVA